MYFWMLYSHLRLVLPRGLFPSGMHVCIIFFPYMSHVSPISFSLILSPEHYYYYYYYYYYIIFFKLNCPFCLLSLLVLHFFHSIMRGILCIALAMACRYELLLWSVYCHLRLLLLLINFHAQNNLFSHHSLLSYYSSVLFTEYSHHVLRSAPLVIHQLFILWFPKFHSHVALPT